MDVPEHLFECAKEIFAKGSLWPPLDIALRLKDAFLEVVGISGDVLLGNELIPAPVYAAVPLMNLRMK